MKAEINNGKSTVEIDDSDLWSLDHTLALVILPALQRFRKIIEGAPTVSGADVPEELRNDEPEDSLNCDTDNFQARWEYVIDEMIYAFTVIVENRWPYPDSSSYEEAQAIMDRVNNGLRLFGKYYTSLWD